jgi:hypothetical protein
MGEPTDNGLGNLTKPGSDKIDNASPRTQTWVVSTAALPDHIKTIRCMPFYLEKVVIEGKHSDDGNKKNCCFGLAFFWDTFSLRYSGHGHGRTNG